MQALLKINDVENARLRSSLQHFNWYRCYIVISVVVESQENTQ